VYEFTDQATEKLGTVTLLALRFSACPEKSSGACPEKSASKQTFKKCHFQLLYGETCMYTKLGEVGAENQLNTEPPGVPLAWQVRICDGLTW
jgi:hypothetical protein